MQEALGKSREESYGCSERERQSELVWEKGIGGIEGQMEADDWLWLPLVVNSQEEKKNKYITAFLSAFLLALCYFAIQI